MCPIYSGRSMPEFTGEKNIVDGKAYDTSLALKVLNWKPSFATFEEFMLNHCDEEMNVKQFW